MLIGWTKSRSKFDLLHVLYLGLAADLVASMMVLLCEQWYPDLLLERALKLLFLDYKHTWCKQNKVPCNIEPFSLTSISLESNQLSIFPALSSRFKAAKVRNLIKWIADATSRSDNDGPQTARATMMAELAQFISMCGSAGTFFSDEEAHRVAQHGRKFLLAYQYENEGLYEGLTDPIQEPWAAGTHFKKWVKPPRRVPQLRAGWY